MSDITKRALSTSLKNLLAKKPLDKITVSSLCLDCGINRQTFYYHFADLADLVEWTCVSDAERALNNKKTYSTWQEGFLAIFALMREDKTFIMNIYHSVSREQLELYLYKLVYKLIREVVEEQAEGMNVPEKDKDFIAHFYKYAFVGLVFDWINRGMEDDPKEIVSHLSQLMKGFFKNALESYSLDK
jgi:probable dihydroxyacetone kinase regulator